MRKIILYIIAFSMLFAVTEATASDCFTGNCTGENSQWQSSGITPNENNK